MDDDKIKIIIVDDSRVTRDLIKHLLSINPHVEIVGTAENGLEALELIQKNPPDVVLTDIVMPKMNGFELTRKIMETNPLPVIVMSGVYNAEEIRRSFDVIDAGAVAIMEKPRGIADEHFAETAKFIFDTARLPSNLRGFSKNPKKTVPDNSKNFAKAVQERVNQKQQPRGKIKALAIGSSVGGPKALQTLLSGFQTNIDVPIFIIQHIAPGFVKGFAEWLNESIPLPVKLANNNEQALAGHVYVAPDKYHMQVDAHGYISLLEDHTQELYVPSIAKLFRSIANSYGPNALGVLLLGAEKDGSKDLIQIKEKGGFTITENSPTKKEIIPKEFIDVSASIEDIGQVLKQLINV